jgi:hypothetical protein
MQIQTSSLSSDAFRTASIAILVILRTSMHSPTSTSSC